MSTRTALSSGITTQRMGGGTALSPSPTPPSPPPMFMRALTFRGVDFLELTASSDFEDYAGNTPQRRRQRGCVHAH